MHLRHLLPAPNCHSTWLAEKDPGNRPQGERPEARPRRAALGAAWRPWSTQRPGLGGPHSELRGGRGVPGARAQLTHRAAGNHAVPKAAVRQMGWAAGQHAQVGALLRESEEVLHAASQGAVRRGPGSGGGGRIPAARGRSLGLGGWFRSTWALAPDWAPALAGVLLLCCVVYTP